MEAIFNGSDAEEVGNN